MGIARENVEPLQLTTGGGIPGGRVESADNSGVNVPLMPLAKRESAKVRNSG